WGRGRATGPPPGRPARPAVGRERGRVEAAWFAGDDLMPFLAMLCAFLGRGFGKGARVLRGVPAQGRRTALAAVRAPRQRGRDQPGPAPLSRSAPPEAPASPDELVTR
ncbi:ATP-grasp domain-containing protein, partial [Streptomyces sp. NPDC059193]